MQKRTLQISQAIFSSLSEGKRILVAKFYPDISINDRILLKEQDPLDMEGGRILEVEVISIQTEIAGLKSNECILGIKTV